MSGVELLGCAADVRGDYLGTATWKTEENCIRIACCGFVRSRQFVYFCSGPRSKQEKVPVASSFSPAEMVT